jgi:hypothetical protein
MLCYEVKFSLQKILTNSNEVRTNIEEKEEISGLDNILSDAIQINLIADNSLILMRIHESRLQYNCSTLIKLDELVEKFFSQSENIVNREVFMEVMYADLTCVDIIVRNMIYFSFEMKKQINNKSYLKGCNVLFNASLKENHSEYSSHLLIISVTCDELKLDSASDSTDSYTEFQKDHFETICTSCTYISQIFGGNFLHYPGNIEISICCQGKKSENFVPKEKIDTKICEWKGGINFAKVTVLMNNKNDRAMIGPILDKFSIKFYHYFLISPKNVHEISDVLRSTDVVFITNHTILPILKDIDYKNSVLLISSNIHYLNSTIFSVADFILPFPYSNEDIDKLQRWFNNPTKVRMLKTNQNSSPTVLDDMKHRYENRFNFISNYLSLGMNTFTPDIEVSFMQWRVLNPTKRFLHVSKLVDVSYFIFLVAILIQSFLLPNATQNNQYPIIINMSIVLVIGVIILFRNILYTSISTTTFPLIKFLRRHISMYTVWCAIPNGISISILLRVYFFVKFSQNMSFTNIVIEEFLNLDIKFISLEIKGSVVLTQIIMQSFVMIVWAMNIPWPFSLIFLCSLFLRNMFYQIIVCQVLIDNDPIFISLISLLSVYYLYCMIMLFQFENTQRNEFQKYRIKNYSRISMRNSIRLCQKDMKNPLDNILTNYKSFLLQINTRLKFFESFNFKTGKVLIGDVNNLYSPISLLNEINFLFSYKNKNTEIKSANQLENIRLTNPMLIDIILLKYELQRIAYIFQTCKLSIAMNLKIYLIVDSDLSLIKTNKKVLFSIITNAISVAIKKINYKIEIDTDIRGKEVHEIIIQINSLDYSGVNSKPFFHTRNLVIDVYDTGFPISNKIKMFGTSICQQMRDDMYCSYDTENIKLKKKDIFNVSNNRFNITYQRIVFPYTLHEKTVKVASLFKSSNRAFDCYNADQLGIKLKLYEDWTSRRISRISHNFSMCFVCPIEDINSKLYQNEFFCHGWKLDTVKFIDQIILDKSLLLSNIILIDYSNYNLYTEISIFFENIADTNSNESHDLDYTCNFLRLMGYKGLIFVLFASSNRYAEYESTISNKKSSFRRNETNIINDYSVIYQPILDITLNNLVESCLHHDISILLNPKLVTLH